MPFDILGSVIPAASALLGVAVGGYFAAHNQKRERQQRRISEQLTDFYSRILGLRAQMLAKSGLRVKISDKADSTWRALMERAYQRNDVRRGNIEHIEKLMTERSPQF
jgi:hypothetical protein